MIIFTGESVSNFDVFAAEGRYIGISCEKRLCSWARDSSNSSLHDLCEMAEEHRKECKP